MHISEIDIYRDGGSIEFFIERDGSKSRVWLETPFRGEPRSLLIDSKKVTKGDHEVNLLSADIREWWTGLDEKMRQLVLEVLSRKDICNNSDEITLKAVELSRVRFVGDYIAEYYT
jgi:hypothetical protein